MLDRSRIILIVVTALAVIALAIAIPSCISCSATHVESATRVLCFGDSNTWGYIPATGERYDSDTRWTGRLANRFSDWAIVEDGLSGRTTDFSEKGFGYFAGTTTLPAALQAQSPLSAVVIMLGANDCKSKYNASVKKSKAGLKKLIEQVRTISGEATSILIVAPPELSYDIVNYNSEMGDKSYVMSTKLKDAYTTLAATEGVEFLAADDYVQVSGEDGIHLDADSHKALADAIGDKLEEMLGTDDEE